MAKKYEVRRRERKDSLDKAKAARVPPRDLGEFDTKSALSAAPSGHRSGRGVVIAICGLLALSTLLDFAQTAGHDFVNCDDNEYVYENAAIQCGLTAKCAWWAITEAHSANWHPLTWMSHALDWQLFGTWDPELDRYVKSWPGGHHLVNLALHALCSVLLFLTLQAMTGATWPSALVAALFAVHPQHVESVAWATGRKDTLSALFFILTLAAYQGYASREFSWWRYSLVIVCFVMGLSSKPMLVTLPFLLLLLDYWPLGRLPPSSRAAASYVRIALEKLPLLALSAGSSYLTSWAQGSVGAYRNTIAFEYRGVNAIMSYLAFIRQMFWPAGMLPQYLHKGGNLRFEDALLPLAALVPLTLAATLFGLRRRYLFVGWFWYVGMLVPVVGLVQVGAQARADRYTYLTEIGLYILIAWGLKDLARYWRGASVFYAASGTAIIAALTFVAWVQTAHWRNSLALWEHATAIEPNNDYAQNSYGDALNASGRTDEANEHYRASFTANPKYLTPYCNLAGNLYKHGNAAEAVKVCDEALKVNTDNPGTDFANVHFLRAVSLYGAKQVDASIREFHVAIEQFGQALAASPKNVSFRTSLADSHGDLAVLLKEQEQYDEARKECHAALALKPESVEAHRTLGDISMVQNDAAGAEKEYRESLRSKPDDGLSQQGLADSLWAQGKVLESAEQYKRLEIQTQTFAKRVEVVRKLIDDTRPEAHADAVEIARQLCERTGNKNLITLVLLACAYAETGDFEQAEAATRKAMETPLGQSPQNTAVLQQRIQAYRTHQKPPIPASKP